MVYVSCAAVCLPVPVFPLSVLCSRWPAVSVLVPPLSLVAAVSARGPLAPVVYDVMTFRSFQFTEPSSAVWLLWDVTVAALPLHSSEVEGSQNLARGVLECTLDLLAGGHGAYAGWGTGKDEVAFLCDCEPVRGARGVLVSNCRRTSSVMTDETC